VDAPPYRAVEPRTEDRTLRHKPTLSTRIAIASGIVAAITPIAINAAEPRKDVRSKALSDVVRCRQVQDTAARLACFDASVALLDSAEQRRDVVVVDSQQVRQARRSLFGIGVPSLSIFSGSPEIDAIDTTVTDAQVDGAGRWTVRMADGARWAQTDDNVLGRSPRAGDKVHIKRAALGSFQMTISGQPGVKARRVN
jgi:hypothetical protein